MTDRRDGVQDSMIGHPRVLVCGSRDYTDHDTLWAALDAFHATNGIGVLIEGEAPGADRLAAEWWQGHTDEIIIQQYPADWAKYGRSAGPIRNRQMLIDGRPDVVLAFPRGPLSQSRGTLNMVEQARKAGVRVIVYGIDDVGVTAAQATKVSFLDPANEDTVALLAKAIRDAHVGPWYTAPQIPAEMYARTVLATIRDVAGATDG